jgi:hypothetical protein
VESYDVEKAAVALLSQHGDRAVRIAEERASRHAIAGANEASALWFAIARAVKQKVSPDPS